MSFGGHGHGGHAKGAHGRNGNQSVGHHGHNSARRAWPQRIVCALALDGARIALAPAIVRRGFCVCAGRGQAAALSGRPFLC
jgi:hypothetical protein